jgi:hypothetical protein
MRHALMYHGAFELNYPAIVSGAQTYRATDGSVRPIPPWPGGTDGLRIGYLERQGKKFLATRLQFEQHDLVLRQPVPLDSLRHLGGRRLSPTPTFISDDLASQLLDDAIAMNTDQEAELALLINRVNQVRRGDRPTV